MKIIYFLLVIAVLSCSSPTDVSENPTGSLIEELFSTESLELPIFRDGEIVYHEHYTLSYNEEYEIANWVAYELTKDELQKRYERRDNFRPDPKVTTGTADDSDYKGSGYDRGHLLPAGDCTWDSIAMGESFYYSNIAPQKPGLNRGEWAMLESYFRDLANQHDTVWIVTGPVLNSLVEFIGPNQKAVPSHFFKAGMYKQNGEWKSEAYVLPNESIDNSNPLSNFKLDLISLEELINYDLYPKVN